MIDLKITSVQSPLHWEDPVANRGHFSSLLAEIDETHVIVLPEMFTTGFTMKPEEHAEAFCSEMQTLGWMRKLASEKDACVTGSVAVNDSGNFHNRILWVRPDGTFSHADKRHLFTLGKEDRHYSPGKSRLTVEHEGWNINLMCCYDLRFPAWCRNSMESGSPEYDLQIFMANWPDKRIEHWDILLKARAVENQSYVCGVNIVGDDGNGVAHSGHSGIYSGMGETVSLHAHNQIEVLTTEILARDLEFLRRSLSFLKDSDKIVLG